MVSPSSVWDSTGKSIDLLRITYGLFFANHRVALTPGQRQYVSAFYHKQLRVHKKTLNLFVLSLPVALVAVLVISTGELISNVSFWTFKLLFWGCILAFAFSYVVIPVIARLRVSKYLDAYDFYTEGRAFYSYPVPDALLAVLMQSHLDTDMDVTHQIRQRIGQWLEDKGWISTENIIQIIQDVHIFHNTKSPQAVKDSALSTANTSTARANHDRYAMANFDHVVGAARGVVGMGVPADSGDSFSPSSSGSSSGSSSSSDSSSSSE